jgi:methylamine---glutamate N-methyltransferase subunit B
MRRDRSVDTALIDCRGRTTREINREIRARAGEGRPLRVAHPDARHNLAVALLEPVDVCFEGSVGYYCAGMMDGAAVDVKGSAGWGLAECMLSGSVLVRGSAGSGAAASIRGGRVAVLGDAGARAGCAMKGGTLVVGGGCGYMTGFMGQKGTIVVCGDAGPALGDSMYETVIYVGGSIAELGNDAVVHAPTTAEREELSALLTPYGLSPERDWKKVAAGRKLWNFDRTEALWREAL